MGDAVDSGRQAEREDAALTERHWVRLTRCCNNRCLFCLDADSQDGATLSRDAVVDDIRRGASLGRRRLVLSGGEPTIHPDFIELVGEGARAGYERVQVITNGRMMARRDFLEAALAAGLGELTLSVHGHRAELHDELVGVPGAFAQTIRGLRNALEHGELIVNVDVVVCRQNVQHLEEILALCIRLGVREFDLLQVQPSGRAGRGDVLYSIEDAAEPLGRVFALSQRQDLFIWTNRFPASHLEGHEELIQDPHKLVDEVRGRAEHFERLLARGAPLRCRGELCPSCFLSPLCDHFHHYADRLRRRSFDEVLVDLGASHRRALGEEPSFFGASSGRVLAPSYADALERLPAEAELPLRTLTLVVDSPEGLPASGPVSLAGVPVGRLASESPAVLDRALGLEIGEVEVSPSLATEGWLRAHRRSDGPTVVVRPAPRERLSTCLGLDLAPELLADLLEGSRLLVEDWPACLAGGRPVTWTDAPLEPETTGAAGSIDLELFVSRFAAERYRTHARRCGACAERARCRGWHVQRARAFGLAALRAL